MNCKPAEGEDGISHRGPVGRFSNHPLVQEIRNSHHHSSGERDGGKNIPPCILVGGFSPPPLKNDGVKVSWENITSQYIESHKIHVPNHQTVYMCL